MSMVVDGVAALSIIDWNGMGGVHFCGSIHWRDAKHKHKSHFGHVTDHHEIRVERVLTEAQAIQMNKLESFRSHDWKHSAGDQVERYLNRDELIADAVEYAREHDRIIALFYSDYINGKSCGQPMRVLYVQDTEYEAELNEVGTQFDEMYAETNDPWRTFRQKTKELEEQWALLLQRAGLLRSSESERRSSKKRRKKK